MTLRQYNEWRKLLIKEAKIEEEIAEGNSSYQSKLLSSIYAKAAQLDVDYLDDMLETIKAIQGIVG